MPCLAEQNEGLVLPVLKFSSTSEKRAARTVVVIAGAALAFVVVC